MLLISDTHFYHDNIINYCDRPFNNTYEMNEYIIKKWNEVVKEDDLIVHLGDFAIGWDKSYKTKKDSYKSIMDRLNGKKVLIKGNHDKESNQFYLDIGFEKVLDNMILTINNKKILFTHYPLEIKKQNSKELNEYISRLKENDYDLVLHGHTHNRVVNLPNHKNFSVELHDYTPQKF